MNFFVKKYTVKRPEIIDCGYQWSKIGQTNTFSDNDSKLKVNIQIYGRNTIRDLKEGGGSENFRKW